MNAFSWFVQPWGLVALLAVPAVVALHWFRRRFAPRRVSALFLWESLDRASVAGRRLERLHRSASFWLELLAAAALALACASPRLPWTRPAKHLVVVLDGSASMNAANAVDSTTNGGESSRARAIASVRARVDALPRRSRVTIVESGPTPRLLAGPAAFPAEATAKLADYEPSLGRHDLGPALALASELGNGGAVTLLTDDFDPERFAPEVELESVGRALDNVGFTHASRTRESSGEHVFLSVASFSRRAERRRMTLLAGRETIDTRELTLEPGERKHLEFTLPPGTPSIAAKLEPDAFTADDELWLAPVVPRVVKLATTLSPETAHALGLGSKELVDRWCSLVPDAVAAEPAQAHVVVGAQPSDGASAWSLVLADANSTSSERRDLIGPFLVEKCHPLLRGVTLDGVVWSVDPKRAWSGAPLVSAGDRPLLTEESQDGRRCFTLHLDPSRSSLHRSPDWPILLANLVEMRRAELPGPDRTNLLTGDCFTARGVGETKFTVDKVAGRGAASRTVDARGTLVVDGLTVPGLYRVGTFEFAVNGLDAAESDLRSLRSGRRASSIDLASAESSFSAADFGLLGSALALLLADWIWLSKRRDSRVERDFAVTAAKAPG
jgi:hypothetical protein